MDFNGSLWISMDFYGFEIKNTEIYPQEGMELNEVGRSTDRTKHRIKREMRVVILLIFFIEIQHPFWCSNNYRPKSQIIVGLESPQTLCWSQEGRL